MTVTTQCLPDFMLHYITAYFTLVPHHPTCLSLSSPPLSPAATLPHLSLSTLSPPPVPYPPPRSLHLSEAPASILSVGVLRLHAGPLHYTKQFDQLFY